MRSNRVIINICQYCSLTPVNALVMPHSTAQVPMYKEGLIVKKTQHMFYQ